MFRKILVPTDLTDRASKALDAAIGVAGAAGHITLIHVIETIAGAEFDEFSSFYRRLEERARALLNEIVGRATDAARPIDVAIVYGHRVEEVLRFAQSRQIDLIVLPSHPVDPSQRFTGMGTMSYKLAILAPCAVLLVK